jgi:hypothetical protein
LKPPSSDGVSLFSIRAKELLLVPVLATTER